MQIKQDTELEVLHSDDIVTITRWNEETINRDEIPLRPLRHAAALVIAYPTVTEIHISYEQRSRDGDGSWVTLKEHTFIVAYDDNDNLDLDGYKLNKDQQAELFKLFAKE